MSDDFSRWLAGIADGDDDAAQKLLDDYLQRMVHLARRKLGKTPRSDFDENDVASAAMHSFLKEMRLRKFAEISNQDNLRNLLFTITAREATARRRYHSAKKRGAGRVLCEADLIKQFEDCQVRRRYEELGSQSIRGYGLAGICGERQRILPRRNQKGKNAESSPRTSLKIGYGKPFFSIPDRVSCSACVHQCKGKKSLCFKMLQDLCWHFRTNGRNLTQIQMFIDVENFQRRLEQLPDAKHRWIALWKVVGFSIEEIAGKLGCVPQTVYNKLDKIRHIWLVDMIGTEPTRELLTDDFIEKYQSRLNRLDEELHKIVEGWLRGQDPKKIADRLSCTPASVYSKLGYVARLWSQDDD